MFIGCDIFHPDAREVINGRPQPIAAGDVGRSRFEFVRDVIVNGLLKSDGQNHVAATLVGRHGFQQLGLAIKRADARRPEELVGRNRVEIAAQRLHVNLHVGRGLGAIHEHGNVPRVRHVPQSALPD